MAFPRVLAGCGPAIFQQEIGQRHRQIGQRSIVASVSKPLAFLWHWKLLAPESWPVGWRSVSQWLGKSWNASDLVRWRQPSIEPFNDVMRNMTRKSDDKAEVERQPMTRTALEKTITERVKSSRAECKEFIGVIIEYVKPKQPGDANWDLKGVKYGRANREACAAAVSASVAQGQLEFELSDPHA